MLVVRGVGVGFTIITVAKAMTTVAATTSSDSRAANRDARSVSPRQRLHKLLAVPGHIPSRVNDLLLLRPDTDAHSRGNSQAKEKSSNKHVVFFHGDIQVSGLEDGGVSRWV